MAPAHPPIDPLASLEALRLPEPPAPRPTAEARGGGRFAWRLGQSANTFWVEVLEALPAARGWRTGARIPMKDLPEPGQAAWGTLGRAEQEALTALRSWNRKPEGLPLPLLAALEGHPHLLWSSGSGDSGSPVVLAREVAALEVREVPGGWGVGLTRRPGVGPGLLCREGDRLLLTGFGPVHRSLDAVLGEGVLLPEGSASRLAALLGRLLPHLPLQTDLVPVPAPEAARPEARIRVWLKGGGERLDLSLRIQPGPALALELPGEGRRMAVAGPPGGRTLRTRDLAFERGRLAQVQALLPATARPLAERLAWRLEGREVVWSFLGALRDLGSKVQLDGVPGQMPRLPQPLELGELVLDLRPGKGGYDLKGTVQGRPLASLLPALRRGGRFLGLEDGSVLDLSGLLGTRLRGLAAWGREAGEGIHLPQAALPLFRGLEDRLLDPRARARVAAQENGPDHPPEGFQGTLRAYQLEGFRWMASRLQAGLGVCLADDMGLGKTVQTAALLAHRSGLGPALVVAPTSVAPNWGAELARFTPGLRVSLLGEGDRAAALREAKAGDVLVASYGLLLSEGEGLASIPWGTVVLDEAHAIKNPATRRAQASRGLQAAGRLALTGTPVENRPEELGSLMGWLLPDLADRFASVGEVEALRAMAAPFLLRRRKAEVLKELPPRTDLTVPVALEEVEAGFHRDLLAGCRAEALAGGAVHVLAALMKLRRACGHPRLVDPAYGGPGAKVDLLLDRLQTLREEGHRCLVFSQFTGLLDLVQERLREGGLSFRRLDGSTPAKARTQAVADFQGGEADVFLISLKAGGTGLNLTAADDVFHLDPWWNPAVEDQASDRAHRMGRTRPVTVHRLVAAGTVEERVLALHARKRDLVADLLEGREQAAPLDRATLEALLG